MAKRYNPAPGWPSAPEGWVPPEGWQPDPSWPPAPPGWQYVVDDTPPPAKRNWFLRHKILSAVGVLLLLAVIGGLASGDPKKSADKPAAAGAVSSPSSSSPPSTQPSSAPASAAPVTTAPAPPPPSPKPVALTYRGRGNKVLSIRKPGAADDPALISVTNVGSQDNFTIYALDAQLKEGDLLVNTIGSYRGSSILDKNKESTQRLKIDGAGTWTITISPLSAARTMTTSLTGKGDEVILYRGPTGVAKVTNRGPEDNFTIYYYGDSNDLLVNDIGSYTGETPIQEGPAFLEIDGAGTWSINVTP
jgi:hypothetical protein